MFLINIKSFFSIIASKLIMKISKVLFKGGTNFPGRIALKLDRRILSRVAKGYTVILVTGTNGKTTTTSMIYNMLKDNNFRVITNSTGANMLPGIVSCFIDNYSFARDAKGSYAVIEADEANVKLVTEYLKPQIITVTNLFRDQLDRYGEVYTTMNKILEGIDKTPESTLVLNGDESLLGELGLENKTIYYGFKVSQDANKIVDLNADAKFCKKCKEPYEYEFITYNHLGSFFCPHCGYKRPELDYFVDGIKELTPEGSLVSINGLEYYINQPGVYNIYNALCALSISSTLGIEPQVMQGALKNIKSSFGRQEALDIDGKHVKIILVKNPAGFDQSVNTITLDKDPVDVAVLLNDNYADGRDVSWIWDVNMEKLSSLRISRVLVSGIRRYDMAVRLKVSGLNPEKFVICDDFQALLESIKQSDCSKVYLLATYTAMINLRKYLNTKGYIKDLW